VRLIAFALVSLLTFRFDQTVVGQAAAPATIVRDQASSLVGLTGEQVRSRIGFPSTVNKAEWHFDSSSGKLRIHWKDGVVTEVDPATFDLAFLIGRLQSPAERPSPTQVLGDRDSNLGPGVPLGRLNLKDYCQAHGYAGTSSWNCITSAGRETPSNLRDACDFHYPARRSVAVVPSDDIRFDSERWICVVQNTRGPVTGPRVLSADSGIYAVRPGNGVASPVPTARPKPQYTVEAMRERIEGSVEVECIVRPSGICADIEVVRSLDSRFGLDEQAVDSVRGWRFKPGTHLGQPVSVLVSIEVTFGLYK
jgi:TonB family protein